MCKGRPPLVQIADLGAPDGGPTMPSLNRELDDKRRIAIGHSRILVKEADWPINIPRLGQIHSSKS